MTGSDLLRESVFSLEYYMSTGNGKIPENARRSTRSHSLHNSLWKRLWTCRKTHCVMMMMIIIIINDHDNDNGGDDEDGDDDEDHDDDDDDGVTYMYSI